MLLLLGMFWDYKERYPKGILSDFVHCFWQYKNVDSEIQYSILPDGFFEVIAEFDTNGLMGVKLKGLWTKPKPVTISSSIIVFGVRLKLSAAEYLMDESIRTLLNTTRSLPFDFWNIDTYLDKGFDMFIEDLSNLLTEKLKNGKEVDARKVKLFNLVYENISQSVEEISDYVGWSSRQINRYFNNQLGCQLKEVLNIVRCQTTFKYIADGIYTAQKGFYDQSHFIKEIKRYCGVTPKELNKNENDRFLQLSTISDK
ncbi:DUF6597 domain-containing transcriptional factor [Carboxylicivirga linearis]|uniref:Helix-turn-helix domain-containing protein n=1 Tax=Carboxylicivirga linearis TaxID=1628157 RepID=A0ABS5JY54_9BACT|nr:DUF6597 domain-containing transcriptional factor [Carboxylicivirga linearis]MBS2099827.1 helix-turn-helix domain-containing protein [Carboxylicivirga linearis]